MESRPLMLPTISGNITAASTRIDRWMLERIRRFVSSAPIRFELWDGFELSPPIRPIGTIRIKNRRTLLSWLWDPDLHFGEAYMSGGVEIAGELVDILEAIYLALPPPARRTRMRLTANDVHTAKENVHHHYDLGNDFYRLWLDREMVYTCAYFPTPDATLEEAQLAKMELICRKLRLVPGERVIEAGCGWGSLAIFMAQRYGVSVRAFNVSTEQVAYARGRAARLGLSDRIEFVEEDYRQASGACDAFVSVGMLEHVGLHDYQVLGQVIARTLAPNGRGFLHFIGRNASAPLNPWIRKRIFPGAYPPTLREVFERVFEPQDLSVLDVENLRLHYAATLAHWRRRFEDASHDVARTFDDAFVRAWRLYLAGSQVAFATGSMQLFQVVFAPGRSNQISWLRVAGL